MNRIVYSFKIQYGSRDLEEKAELQSEVKEVHSEEKIGKQGFHFNIWNFMNQLQKQSKVPKKHLKTLNLKLQQLKIKKTQKCI